MFFANVGRHFLKSNKLGCHFSRIFRDGFYSDFQRFFLNFQQIKTFGDALAPPPPTPLRSLTM